MANSNKDLLYAILAMDAYNQGYARGIEHDQSKIGSATVKRREEFTSDEEYAAWQAAGFYASAYEIDGAVVISYRGTDAILELFCTDGPIMNGDFDEPSIHLASKFYNAVAAGGADWSKQQMAT